MAEGEVRGADQAGWFPGSVLVLGEAGVHQLPEDRRARSRSCTGSRGQQALGLREQVSTDAQLLHAAAWAGGTAGRHLHRLEAARYAGRHRGRHLLRHTLDLRFAPALISCGRPLRRARDQWPPLRGAAGRDSDRGRGGHQDRQAHPQPRRPRRLRGAGLRGPVFLLRPLPTGHLGRRHRRVAAGAARCQTLFGEAAGTAPRRRKSQPWIGPARTDGPPRCAT